MRGILLQWFTPLCRSKGNQVNIPEPGHGGRPHHGGLAKSGNANEPGDAGVESREEFSFLVKVPKSLEWDRPEIGTEAP